MSAPTPELYDHWRYKPNRGSGTFVVIRIRGDRITLKDALGMRRPKTVSLRTLRGDYERVA